MGEIDFQKALSTSQVCDLLATREGSAWVYAGGTDLLVRIKNGVLTSGTVVDISGISELDYITVNEGQYIRIGAMARLSNIEKHPIVAKYFIALCEAIGVIGSVQIRNLATLAGNICNASPAADTAPPLVAYGASVNIIGPSGTRRLPVEEFLTGPGKTALNVGEMVESIDLPLSRGVLGASFKRFGRRKAVELATVSSAAVITEDRSVYLCAGAVAERPVRLKKTEQILTEVIQREGFKPVDKNLFTTVRDETRPITDVRATEIYRRSLAETLTRRAFNTAVERALEAGDRSGSDE
ncbi:MAG: FAD binding domain-containing protein [Spirochaetota bacterium]